MVGRCRICSEKMVVRAWRKIARDRDAWKLIQEETKVLHGHYSQWIRRRRWFFVIAIKPRVKKNLTLSPWFPFTFHRKTILQNILCLFQHDLFTLNVLSLLAFPPQWFVCPLYCNCRKLTDNDFNYHTN